MDIPKEVCARARRNPRKINKPVIKKWCYTPTEESGLGNFNPSSTPSNTDDNDSNGDPDETSTDLPPSGEEQTTAEAPSDNS